MTMLAQMNQPATFALGWILMFLLILVVFGIIAAIVWRSWLAGGIVLFVVLLIAAFMFSVRSYDRLSAPTATIVSEVGRQPIPWEPTPDHLRNADVYSTMDDAANALAERVVEKLDARPRSKDIAQIHITDSKNIIAPRVKEVFEAAYPKAQITISNSSPADRGALRLGVDSYGIESQKEVVLTAQLSDFHERVSARVQPKLWVNNPTEFMNINKRGKWLIGWSNQPQYTNEGARASARADAIRQLIPLVRPSLPRTSSAQPLNDHWLHQHLDREIQMGRFKKEEFVQRMNLPISGQQVYRAGVLLDASPNEIRLIQGGLNREISYHANRTRNAVLSVVGLGALICFLYLFLNWSTRGYFQMNLRLAAFLVLIAGVLFILLMT